MRFALKVGDEERCRIEFSRNWFTGRASVNLDGESTTLKSPFKLSTHFSFQRVNRYECTVGRRPTHKVVIEHERPLLFGGFWPNTYRVFVDGSLAEEHCGF